MSAQFTRNALAVQPFLFPIAPRYFCDLLPNRYRCILSAWQGAWSRRNPALRWIVLGGSAGLALVLSVPVLRELFHFSRDTLHIFGIGALAACCVMLFSAAVKPGMKPTETDS